LNPVTNDGEPFIFLGQAARFKLQLPEGQLVTVEDFGGSPQILASSWHPGFGISENAQKLLIAFNGSKLTTRISWSSD